jgi:hypothetical protein
VLRQHFPLYSFLAFIVALVPALAHAQPKFIRSDFEFTAVAPPVSLSWQLATPGGEHVDLSITGIAPAAGSQLAYIITPENAAQYSVDFSAWSLAVNDPAYSRSIMTWAGVTKESPVVHRFPHLELDDLRVFVDDYWWPVPGGNNPAIYVTAFASDNPVVPEPASWMLAASSLIVSFTTSRFPSRKWYRTLHLSSTFDSVRSISRSTV